MLVLSEDLVPDLLSVDDAVTSVEASLAALDRGEACCYPIVREALGYRDATFGIKSGFDHTTGIAGLKAGGYWPHNAEAGLPNHQSVVLLFEPKTGRAVALIGANYLTAVRTGAASAIATKHLARSDAKVLSLIGAGAQAKYQLLATLLVRKIQTVFAWDPCAQNLDRLEELVGAHGLTFRRAAHAEEAIRAADVLVTITPSCERIVMKEWVRPGTHINAMGADTEGKQELDTVLVASANIYVDLIEQATTVGECQHAFRAGLIGRNDLKKTLGGLASGRLPGRADDKEVTLFDSTGIVLQDLAPAGEAIRRARERGIGTTLQF